jgi:IQ calmodulin-binding motif
MATVSHPQLAPVTARDGVDTRKQAPVLSGDSLSMDTIMDLGLPAAQQGMAWGDILVPSVLEYDHVPEHSDMNLWKDMIEEPWKYGDDIVDWLELDEGVARWRKAAYWALQTMREQDVLSRDQECWKELFNPIAKECARKSRQRWINKDVASFVRRITNAVVRIQSAVRGYLVRKNQSLDCCMCLRHCLCTVSTEVGFICDACVEQGPYEDIIDNDPWNWFRAIETTKCKFCRCPSEEDFCSLECKYDYAIESYKFCQ